jgi:hypothetical protein
MPKTTRAVEKEYIMSPPGFPFYALTHPSTSGSVPAGAKKNRNLLRVRFLKRKISRF